MEWWHFVGVLTGFCEIVLTVVGAIYAYKASQGSKEAVKNTELSKTALNNHFDRVVQAATAAAHAQGRLLRADDIRDAAAQLVDEAGAAAEKLLRDAKEEADLMRKDATHEVLKIRLEAMQEAARLRSQALNVSQESMEKAADATANKVIEKRKNGH